MANELKLIEGEDFFYDKNGLMILTKEYLLKRGRCCQSGCEMCPYSYDQLVNPAIPAELQNPYCDPKESDEWTSEPLIYDKEIPEDFQ